MKQPQIDALAKVLPSALVEAVLAKNPDKRERKLPRLLVLWTVIGAGLYRHLNLQKVVEQVSRGLDWRPWTGKTPCATSISKACERLGWESVRELFRGFAAHLQREFRQSNLWLGHEVFTLDGSCLKTPDTKANEGWFGRPRCSRGGKSGFPQLRCVLLVGVWTHLIGHAVFGPYTTSEMRLADYALASLSPGAVLLVDRAYYGFRWATLFLRHQAHFVVRMKQGKSVYRVKKLRRLGADDWLCLAQKPMNMSRNPGGPSPDLQVRVIRCKRPGFRAVFVMTDLVCPVKYPATEIVALYRDRWEAELAYREIKVYLAGTQVTFRSKKAARVLQEAYGLLLAYNCVRATMCQAAVEENVRPTRLGFSECLTQIRWAIDRGASASHLVLALRSTQLPPKRVGRTYVRAVKQKFTSHFPRKRTDQPIAGNPRSNRARRRTELVSPMT